MRSEKVLVSLHICAGLSEPPLLTNVVSTKISCAGPNDFKEKYLIFSIYSDTLKPVSHRTRLGTPFQYGILGDTRVDWYEYLAPTVPGDVLVRLRHECSTSMYEQSTDTLDQARFVTV